MIDSLEPNVQSLTCLLLQEPTDGKVQKCDVGKIPNTGDWDVSVGEAVSPKSNSSELIRI